MAPYFYQTMAMNNLTSMVFSMMAMNISNNMVSQLQQSDTVAFQEKEEIKFLHLFHSFCSFVAWMNVFDYKKFPSFRPRVRTRMIWIGHLGYWALAVPLVGAMVALITLIPMRTALRALILTAMILTPGVFPLRVC
jgi:hypothetical protein